MFHLLAQPQKPTIPPRWPEQMRPLFWWKNTELHLSDTFTGLFSLAPPCLFSTVACEGAADCAKLPSYVSFLCSMMEKNTLQTASVLPRWLKHIRLLFKLLPNRLGAGQAVIGRFIKSEMWSRLWWRVSEERGVGWSSGQGQKTKERERWHILLATLFWCVSERLLLYGRIRDSGPSTFYFHSANLTVVFPHAWLHSQNCFRKEGFSEGKQHFHSDTVRPLICAEFSGNFLLENSLEQSVGRQFCFQEDE